MNKANSRVKILDFKPLWVVLGFVIPFILHFLTNLGLKESYYSLLLFGIGCIIIYNFATKKKYNKELSNILLGFTGFVTAYFFYNLLLSYVIFQRYDFLCFYLFGKVGISSSDFYNPHVFATVFNNLHLQTLGAGSFVNEVVNVGFWYPPPSMLLFFPLGLFNLQTAYIVWQSVIIIFLLLDILLLIKFYFFPLYKNYQDPFLFFPFLILIFLFPYITVMISLSQTISIFLFFLILLIRNLDNWKSGVFLAILVVIKPLAAIFILYFFIYKKWKIIGASIITGIILLVATGAIFGFQVFFNFFHSPPTDRIPDSIYLEYSSLYGVLKKIQLYSPRYMTLTILKIIYYFLSVVLAGLTIYFSKKLSSASKMNAFLIFIPAALLIYPASLFHYILILLPVFLYIFYKKPLTSRFTLLLLFFLFGIGYYSLFILSSILWVILASWPLSKRLIEKKLFS